MQFKTLTLAAICAVSMALPAWAHHSHGNYQMSEYTELKGTISEIHWLVPHSWIYLEVKENEEAEPLVWALEGASVTQLMRRGWTRESLNVGDTISVRCHRLRDGSNGCLLGFITTADGEEREFD